MNKEQLLNTIIEAHNYLVKCEVKGQSVFDLANAMARTQTLINELSKEEQSQPISVPSGPQMPPCGESVNGDENFEN